MRRVATVLFFAILCSCKDSADVPQQIGPMSDDAERMRLLMKPMMSDILSDEELELIERIISAQSQEERENLIAELEKMPVKYRPFYARWMAINEVDDILGGWTDTGYEAPASKVHRNIQLLDAVDYGKSDIENGGFHQFFTNGTGVFAPEMTEWFERTGLVETASVMKKAIAVFGDDFPRSWEDRTEFLAEYEHDPFDHLNEPFYDSISRREELYNSAANRWLRETCGISDLKTTLPAEQDGADQPATAPESKPEDDSKPQSESNGRPE
ncbi:MAG: DUF4375 domain-containing protein [Verrucomicrobiota bacterium]